MIILLVRIPSTIVSRRCLYIYIYIYIYTYIMRKKVVTPHMSTVWGMIKETLVWCYIIRMFFFQNVIVVCNFESSERSNYNVHIIELCWIWSNNTDIFYVIDYVHDWFSSGHSLVEYRIVAARRRDMLATRPCRRHVGFLARAICRIVFCRLPLYSTAFTSASRGIGRNGYAA